MISDMSQTVWIEAQQQWVSSWDLSYHPCLKVRSRPGVLQPFEWRTSAWGSNSTWATFSEIHMQTAELFLQEGWGHWIIVVEVFLFLSDAQLFVFTAAFQARDLMMDFCKSDWHFQHLKGNFFLSVAQTPSQQTSNFFYCCKYKTNPFTSLSLPFYLYIYIHCSWWTQDPATCPEVSVKVGAGQVCTSSRLWTPVELLVWSSREELALATKTTQSSTLAELFETGTE